MAIDDSAHSTEIPQEHDTAGAHGSLWHTYVGAAIAYEARAAEGPADDAILSGLRGELERRERDIMAAPEQHSMGVEKLAVMARMLGGFKPTRDRIGEFANSVVVEFDRRNRAKSARMAELERGVVYRTPDAVEQEHRNLRVVTWLLVQYQRELSPASFDQYDYDVWNAEQSHIGYLADRLEEHVAALDVAIHGRREEDDAEEQEEAA